MRHLRYVIAAAEHRSFRRAGAAIGVQQSAISRRIRDLEDELGVALFIRHHGGVKLTHAGRRFLQRAQAAVGQIQSAAKDASSAGRGEEGHVRIGIISSMACGYLAELLDAYRDRNPGISAEFVEGGPGEHICAVQQHRLDVAFLTGPAPADGCDREHLWSERVFVILPNDHELAARREVSWGDLRDRHFIVSADPSPEVHDRLSERLTAFGYRPSIEHVAVRRDNLLKLVSMGKGLSLTTEAMTGAAFPGVVYRPIVGEEIGFSAVWLSGNDNPAFRRLLSLARAMSRRHKPS